MMRAPKTASLRTRDGVRLDADIYRPYAEGPHPVLLMRQPYGRKIASTVCYAHPQWYAQHGYIVVIQDVRGRGTSEGVFRTLQDEAADGADTIAWAAALPGCNGRVGMYGFSYQGTDQLLAASLAPPALCALAPAMIGWDLAQDWAYEGSAFCLQAGLGWAIQIAAESAKLAGDAAAFDDLRRAAQALPLQGTVPARPEVMQRHAALSHYQDWLEAPPGAPYWDRVSPAAHIENLVAAQIPSLFIGGWFDSHLPGTLAGYRALASRLPSRLVVGPWAHFPWGRRIGGLDFGADAIGRIDQLQVAWFDRWLKDAPDNGAAPVRLFDMGALQWRDFPAWPQQGCVLHLHGTGRAAMDERDGVLSPAPGAPGFDMLVHDPWRPVPGAAAATDRAAIDQRPDVLTYTTAPYATALPLAGAIHAELDITADAPDFDVSCVLSRVKPNGQSFAIAEGYCRVSAPGPVRIPMRATCLTVPPGEALRLSVAGAAFPAFPVNPGTGQNPTQARAMDARIITLSLAHGSRLVIGG